MRTCLPVRSRHGIEHPSPGPPVVSGIAPHAIVAHVWISGRTWGPRPPRGPMADGLTPAGVGRHPGDDAGLTAEGPRSREPDAGPAWCCDMERPAAHPSRGAPPILVMPHGPAGRRRSGVASPSRLIPFIA